MLKVPKKKQTIDQKLKLAIINEIQEDTLQFGVSGVRVALAEEETKESVIGRRDLFNLPEELQNEVRVRKQSKGRQQIIKQKTSLIAKLQEGHNTGLDFNIAGT